MVGVRTISLAVRGTPAPQGSKRAFVHKTTGRAVVVESSKKVKPWRAAVQAAAEDMLDGQTPIDGPLEARLTFFFDRPRGHFGTGKNAGQVKASSPERPAVRPDIDKVVRSTLDALGFAGVFADDSQIVTLVAHKFYVDGVAVTTAGAQITVQQI